MKVKIIFSHLLFLVILSGQIIYITNPFNLRRRRYSMQDEKVCIRIEEARKMVGIGRNLMLELIKVDGFPCIRFK